MLSTTHSSPRVRRRRGPIAVAVAGAMNLAGCGGDGAAGTDDGPVTGAHVHGLTVDPADGELYAGTHDALIRMPADGEPTRIADRDQDFMSFTRDGGSTFSHLYRGN